MNGTWHRVGVYWGLREDPDLKAQWNDRRPDARTTVIGLMLGIVAFTAVFSVVVLVIRLIASGNTSPDSVVWGGTRLLWGCLVLGALIAGIVRWARWLVARLTR